MDLNKPLDQVLKVSKAMEKAEKYINKTITYRKKNVMDDAVIALKNNPDTNIHLFGVKDTNQIPKELVSTLSQLNGFVFHTVDVMAEGGRAIDVNLINPLTGKVMTGSSSGSCVNILLGINDFVIGTDGGGSVLAPAISCGLYSIMGKGLGLQGNTKRQSTDSIEFIPGIGVISHDFELCKNVVKELIDTITVKPTKYKIAIPKEGSNILPSGIDMFALIKKILEEFIDELEIIEIPEPIPHERTETIKLLQDLFEKVDLVITAEGPIDLYNLGDSVLGQWGKTGAKVQSNSGKYFIKVANMVNATAINIPTEELATSIVVMAPQGIDQGFKAISLAEKISNIYKKPDLFTKYFIESYKQKRSGFLDNI